MGKIRVGNKQNSFLNKQWAQHAKEEGKKRANSVRRRIDKEEANKSED